MVGGLVPASFLLGNVIVIAAVTLSKEVCTMLRLMTPSHEF
jgi:hypothetical protein